MFYKENESSFKSVSTALLRTADEIKLKIYWWEKHIANITTWLH